MIIFLLLGKMDSHPVIGSQEIGEGSRQLSCIPRRDWHELGILGMINKVVKCIC